MSLFRFIHASDFHICIEPNRYNIPSLLSRRPSAAVDVIQTADKYGWRSLVRPASYRPELLEAFAEFVHDWILGCDAIVISGDLATTNLATDLRDAHRFVEGVTDSGWHDHNTPVMNASGRSVVLIPGNHDHYSGEDYVPNRKNFQLQFSAHLESFKGGRVGHRILEKGAHNLAFVCGDLSFSSTQQAKGKLHGYGGGYADTAVLQGMIHRTQELRRALQTTTTDVEVAWLIHFAPFPCGRYLELLGYDSVIDAAKRANVRAIFCGHTHRPQRMEVDGLIIYCAGSAASVDCKNAAHIVEFDPISKAFNIVDHYYNEGRWSFG